MTVEELIERLSKLNLSARVFAFDPNSGADEEVTGLLFDDHAVIIQTDEL